ncbi:MAG TPA: hypothetical protein VLE72_01895 [Candidatus Saccharimonadales bacterium]|nr:hypothetical protein [Candidatus Saccharimonadales bacterium]
MPELLLKRFDVEVQPLADADRINELTTLVAELALEGHITFVQRELNYKDFVEIEDLINFLNDSEPERSDLAKVKSARAVFENLVQKLRRRLVLICRECLLPHGKCRCGHYGRVYGGEWLHYSQRVDHWLIAKPRLMDLSEDDLKRLHPSTRARLQRYIQFLQSSNELRC